MNTVATPTTKTTGRVLVIDDDDEIRAVVSTALRCDGHEVLEARNGLEVLEGLTANALLAHEPYPDVIVTDIRMPGVSGLTLLAGLRATGCDCPVVVMTAYAGPNVVGDAESLGASALFNKPFDIDDLRTAVLNLVHRGPFATIPEIEP
jgi:CheY-like chemotaxis protein